ncbi:helix-turn-helix domain-containing protein [Candidatus Pacearchaeota archaeon]|nr:helix-turn-helix domain-containing protein [Candidatus Pacearchaeota archaeon]
MAYFPDLDETYVEAIEEGKIVRVSEKYAKREGLLILRKASIETERKNQAKKIEDLDKRIGFEELRKPLKWKENKVIKELVENFHWQISLARKKKNLTRKALAEAIGESESTIKLVENGMLPKDDFVLINKIQEKLGINLRKDKNQEFNQSMRKLVDSPFSSSTQKQEETNRPASSDIEIIE